MRTLVSTRDILEAAASPLFCPRCGPASTPITVLTSHLDISRKGTVSVTRTAECAEHGHFTLTSNIKAARMMGRDAQIIPRYE